MANKVLDTTATVKTQQIDTFTLNNDFNDGETDITITFTSEDGSTTETASITPDGTDESVIATALQVELAASSEPLIAAITWTVLTTVVTGTAKVNGTPFYAASSVTGGAGSITDATPTANSGPNDWNTAANWGPVAAVPVDGDDVILTGDMDDMIFGLDQSDIQLTSLKVSQSYKDKFVGNSVQSLYLIIDATTVVIDSQAESIWLDGTYTNVFVQGGRVGDNMLRLKGTITNLRILGPNVQGKVTVADGADLTNCYVLGAPQARLEIGESVTSFALLEVDSGVLIENKSAVTTIRNSGTFVKHEIGAVTLLETRGNSITEYNSDGTLGTATIFDGTMDWRQNTSDAVTVTNAVMHTGRWLERGAIAVVTKSNDLIVYGGDVQADAGVTLAFS